VCQGEGKVGIQSWLITGRETVVVTTTGGGVVEGGRRAAWACEASAPTAMITKRNMYDFFISECSFVF
jgi:hypothetical protein